MIHPRNKALSVASRWDRVPFYLASIADDLVGLLTLSYITPTWGLKMAFRVARHEAARYRQAPNYSRIMLQRWQSERRGGHLGKHSELTVVDVIESLLDDLQATH